MRIRFVREPYYSGKLTGELTYAPGVEADFPDEVAREIIRRGAAVDATPPPPKSDPVPAEKPKARRRKKSGTR